MRMDEASNFAFKVAYIMTHYPRVALTYIAGEIDEVERNGGEIFPVVMNLPAQGDLTTEEARDRQRRGVYLKASPIRVAVTTIGATHAHAAPTKKRGWWERRPVTVAIATGTVLPKNANRTAHARFDPLKSIGPIARSIGS